MLLVKCRRWIYFQQKKKNPLSSQGIFLAEKEKISKCASCLQMCVEFACSAGGQHSCLRGVRSDRPPQSDSLKNTFWGLRPSYYGSLQDFISSSRRLLQSGSTVIEDSELQQGGVASCGETPLCSETPPLAQVTFPHLTISKASGGFKGKMPAPCFWA